MRNVSVLCPICKTLVPVADKTIQEHGGGCPASGMRYVPSPLKFKAGPGGPQVEVLAAAPVMKRCDDFSKETLAGVAALVKVTQSDPTVN